jgi:glycosyltransferase involved in cell wall biosynthesis
MKKVSVIIPVYNAEKYIAATVRSVLDQTYSDWEMLIIDDGSPDRSVEICQQFTDPRIKIISQNNRGLPGARNTGIRHAQGDYLALLDADDLWLPEKIEKHIEHLENSPDVGVSFSRSAFINEAGKALGNHQMPKLKNITPPYLLSCNPVGNGSAALIRREAFEAIQFQDNLYGTVESFYFDEQLRESNADMTDQECWLRIALQTPWKVEGIPDILTLYRVNSQGLSANLSKQLEATEKMIEKTSSYAPELIAQWGNSARAFNMRYIARRAVTLKDGKMAVQQIHRALATHWQIILEEPRSTLLTWAAAYLLWLLPEQIYALIEVLALKATGYMQKRRILRDKAQQSL